MAVDKTDRSVASLVAEISSGEIKLPEIQRGYIWKPTQVAKLIESLYRQYPSGSLLFWRTDETPQTRAVAANAPTVGPARPPLYLLDGQQRLTSLHRVFTDHPDAQVVFNVETEKFQNQSAATRRDPRWIKVHEVIAPDAHLLETQERLRHLGIDSSRDIGRRLHRLASIPDYRYHMEILTDLPYNEVTQIFVRVNSGGRPLKTTDLALATLSARWPGVLGRLEGEAGHWRSRGYGDLDVTFLTRALTGAVLGRGLSVWSHGRLVAATDEELESGWVTVQRGLRHLVPMLQANLRVTHSSLLPSVNVLLPLVVLLGERPDEPLDPEIANGIVYWFLVATLRNRYSSGADTLLGQDIPAAREDQPVHALLANLGLAGGRVEVTEPALAGRGVTSPYFFASFLVAQRHGARDWWYGTEISAGAEGGMKLEHHHVHPQATLKGRYSKAEINDLANLAFISAQANRRISDRSPAEYFPTLGEQELDAHSVPLDESLRTVDTYRAFLAARRRLLAQRMSELLEHYRPSWLDTLPAAPSDGLSGCSVDLVVYESGWEEGRLLITARTGDSDWISTVSLPMLESALTEAAAGIAADICVGEETVPVRVENEDIEIPLGPFVLFGTARDWTDVLARERADAQPISQCPPTPTTPWEGESRVRFPITSSE